MPNSINAWATAHPLAPMPKTRTGADISTWMSSRSAGLAALARSAPARRRPTSATVGVAARVRATEAMSTDVVFAPSSVRIAGSDRITKANSDAWAIRNPSCIDPGVDHRKIRLAAMLETILAAMINAAMRRIAGPQAGIGAGAVDRAQ